MVNLGGADLWPKAVSLPARVAKDIVVPTSVRPCPTMHQNQCAVDELFEHSKKGLIAEQQCHYSE